MFKDGAINSQNLKPLYIAIDKYIQSITNLKPDGQQGSKYTRIWRALRDYFLKQYKPDDYTITPELVKSFIDYVERYFSNTATATVKVNTLSNISKSKLRIGLRTKAYTEDNKKYVFTLYDLIDGYDIDNFTFENGYLTSIKGHTAINVDDFVKNPESQKLVIYTENSLIDPNGGGNGIPENAEAYTFPWYIWAAGGFFIWKLVK